MSARWISRRAQYERSPCTPRETCSSIRGATGSRSPTMDRSRAAEVRHRCMMCGPYLEIIADPHVVQTERTRAVPIDQYVRHRVTSRGAAETTLAVYRTGRSPEPCSRQPAYCGQCHRLSARGRCCESTGEAAGNRAVTSFEEARENFRCVREHRQCRPRAGPLLREEGV